MKLVRAWASMRPAAHLAWFFFMAVIVLFIAAHLVHSVNLAGMLSAIATLCIALAFLFGLKASPDR